MPYWPHLNQPECKQNSEIYDGMTCDNTVQVRRIAWFGYEPATFTGQPMKITQWDDDVIKSFKTNRTFEAMLNEELPNKWSVVPFRPRKEPDNGWAMPFVTGHTYRINWGDGIDFTQMMMEASS